MKTEFRAEQSRATIVLASRGKLAARFAATPAGRIEA
jgi:hypothetical protein